MVFVMKTAGSQPALHANSAGIHHTHTHRDNAMSKQMLKFPPQTSMQKGFLLCFSFITITISTSRVANAEVWIDKMRDSMCFHSTMWLAEIFRIPGTRPERLPPSRVTSRPNTSPQTRFSTSRAKQLPYPISHPTSIGNVGIHYRAVLFAFLDL